MNYLLFGSLLTTTLAAAAPARMVPMLSGALATLWATVELGPIHDPTATGTLTGLALLALLTSERWQIRLCPLFAGIGLGLGAAQLCNSFGAAPWVGGAIATCAGGTIGLLATRLQSAPSFAPRAVRDEALLWTTLFAGASVLLPRLTMGWASAQVLNSDPAASTTSNTPAIWPITLVAAALAFGGWSAWRSYREPELR